MRLAPADAFPLAALACAAVQLAWSVLARLEPVRGVAPAPEGGQEDNRGDREVEGATAEDE